MNAPPKGKRWYAIRIGAAVFLIALLILTLVVTTKKDTSNAVTALWTFILFAVGFGASYYFGQQSVSDAAQDVVRPQAKAAARRLVTLGAGLATIRKASARHRQAAKQTSEAGNGEVPFDDWDLAFDSLDLQIELQTKMVVDALRDWQQFDPEITPDQLDANDDE